MTGHGEGAAHGRAVAQLSWWGAAAEEATETHLTRTKLPPEDSDIMGDRDASPRLP